MRRERCGQRRVLSSPGSLKRRSSWGVNRLVACRLDDAVAKLCCGRVDSAPRLFAQARLGIWTLVGSGSSRAIRASFRGLGVEITGTKELHTII